MSIEHAVLLDQAKVLARNSEYAEARKILLAILESDPHNEVAWIWLVDVLPSTERRVEALERCLELNPDSRAAKISLRRILEGHPPITREDEPWRPEPEPIRPPPLPPPPPKPPLSERIQARLEIWFEAIRLWKGWRWVWVLLSTWLIVFAGALGVVGMFFKTDYDARVQATATRVAEKTGTVAAVRAEAAAYLTDTAPTLTPTPTVTITPTPTLTPTITPSPTTTLPPDAIAADNVAEIEEMFTLDVDSALSLAFSPDNETLAIGDWNGNISVWDVDGERERYRIAAHDAAVYGLAISPDGEMLASGSWDKTIKFWNLDDGEAIMTLEGHSNLIFDVTFSPDGATLASGDADGVLKLWDVRSGAELHSLPHDAAVYSLAFSPTDNVIASGTGVNADEGAESAVIKLWDVEVGDEVLTLEGHRAEVYGLDFSPDGATLLSGSADGVVRMWDVYAGEQLRGLRGHDGTVIGVAFAPHGRLFASASQAGAIILWHTESGEKVYTLSGEGDVYWRVAFSPNGYLLAATAQDGPVRVWGLK
ncbi:MAG: hypothetical protein JXB38_09815 [Anaerolineales bacterium]|nr:hypothetical protein [Anaerolineales bacterium]